MAFCEPARVVSARRLTPNMIRVELEAIGGWRWPTDGHGDERIDIAFPFPGEHVAQIEYFNRADYGRSSEHAEHDENDAHDGHDHEHDDDDHADAADAPPWRHYTVRKVADRGRRLDIDFVVHDGGVASGWAERAQTGDVLGVFYSGDTSSYYNAPSDAALQLLVADATGLPGLGRIIEGLRPGAQVHAVIEVASALDEQHFETAGNVSYTWLHGSGLGTSPSALATAVEGLELAQSPGYAWIACEAAESRAIRRHLRAVRGMARNSHHAIGYWTAGHVGHFEQEREQEREQELEQELEALRS